MSPTPIVPIRWFKKRLTRLWASDSNSGRNRGFQCGQLGRGDWDPILCNDVLLMHKYVPGQYFLIHICSGIWCPEFEHLPYGVAFATAVFAPQLYPGGRSYHWEVNDMGRALGSATIASVPWATKVMTSASMYFLWKRGSWLLWPTVLALFVASLSLWPAFRLKDKAAKCWQMQPLKCSTIYKALSALIFLPMDHSTYKYEEERREEY